MGLKIDCPHRGMLKEVGMVVDSSGLDHMDDSDHNLGCKVARCSLEVVQKEVAIVAPGLNSPSFGRYVDCPSTLGSPFWSVGRRSVGRVIITTLLTLSDPMNSPGCSCLISTVRGSNIARHPSFQGSPA